MDWLENEDYSEAGANAVEEYEMRKMNLQYEIGDLEEEIEGLKIELKEKQEELDELDISDFFCRG